MWVGPGRLHLCVLARAAACWNQQLLTLDIFLALLRVCRTPRRIQPPTRVGAGALAQSSLRRMAAAPAAAAAAAAAASGGRKALTEDDEMALAIAMSMGDEGPQGGAAGPAGQDGDDDEELEEAEEQRIWQQIAEQERQAKEVADRKTPEQVRYLRYSAQFAYTPCTCSQHTQEQHLGALQGAEQGPYAPPARYMPVSAYGRRTYLDRG